MMCLQRTSTEVCAQATIIVLLLLISNVAPPPLFCHEQCCHSLVVLFVLAEAQEFKKKFEEAAEENSKLINMAAVPTAGDGTADAADELAEGLSKTQVDDTPAADEAKPAAEETKAE